MDRIKMRDDGGGFTPDGEYVFPDGHAVGDGVNWAHVLGRDNITPSHYLGHTAPQLLGRRDPGDFPPLEAAIFLYEGEREAAEAAVVPAVGHEALQHA